MTKLETWLNEIKRVDDPRYSERTRPLITMKEFREAVLVIEKLIESHRSIAQYQNSQSLNSNFADYAIAVSMGALDIDPNNGGPDDFQNKSQAV